MKVFLTGTTGYIGGSVAVRLVQAGYSVRGLARGGVKADALAASGITAVPGTLDDYELLKAEARAADGVVNAADSRHRGAIQALIDGLRGSSKPLIHTSGIGMVSRDTQGEASREEAMDDAGPVAPGPHLVQQTLRMQEQLVLDAAVQGTRSCVLSNSLIYGVTLGLPAESVQLPLMARQARADGEARFVGRGLNRWSNAHIADVADLYVRALERAPAGTFYFVENGEASFADMAEAIARRLGLGSARSWSLENAAAVLGEMPARYLLGSDSRVRATCAKRDLGWAPQHTTITDWIKREMPLADEV